MAEGTRMTNFAKAVANFAGASLACSVAAAGPELAVSTAGVGDAKFGTDIESVERAIGRPLLPPKGKSKAQVRGMLCSYVGIADLAEVMLRFEKGRFTAVDINTPNVGTRSGFKVGDPEKSVVDKLKGDPTYTRNNNHYDDAVKEITVGKFEMVGQGQQKKPSGYLLKFTSEKGRITHIQAGAADYVTLVEHDEDCDS